MRTVLALGAALLSAAVAAFPTQPTDPIIGIFTAPNVDCPAPPASVTEPTLGCVHSLYPDWLKGAGVRAIAVPWNSTEAELAWYMKRVNGLFFMGGGLDYSHAMDLYLLQVQKVIATTLEWNKQGDPFLLWGTCEGFQTMIAAIANTLDVIQGKYLGMYPSMMPLQFTAAQPTSRMFSDARMGSKVKAIFTKENSTVNYHHLIVKTTDFAKYPALKNTLTPLSTNMVPNNGTQFVSAFEGTYANIYGVQFHPERPPLDFSNDAIKHTTDDITASQYMANFLASRLKLNSHSFDSAEQAEALMLQQYQQSYAGWGKSTFFITKKNVV